jgi:hypothetical protein
MNIEKLYQTVKNWFRPYTKEEQELIVERLRQAKEKYLAGTILFTGYSELEIIDVEWDYKAKCPTAYCFDHISQLDKNIWLTEFKL